MFDDDTYEQIYQPTVTETEGRLTIRGLEDDSHNLQQPLVGRSNGAGVPPPIRRGAGAEKKNAKSLMERMHNIVSIYIPAKDDGGSEDGQILMGDEAHERMMSSSRSSTDAPEPPTTQITPNYIFQKILDFKSITFEDGYSLVSNHSAVFSLTAIPSATIYFTVQHDEYLYKIHLPSADLNTENDNKQQSYRGERIAMEWRGHRFIPHHVMYNNLSHLFISGDLLQPEVNKNMLVITDLHGTIVHVSRQYDFPRFGALSGDVDGRIFVVHPQLTEGSRQSGLSKMRPNFAEKSFCLFFGNNAVNYGAEYVAGHCLGGFSWVSAKRQDLINNEISSESSAESHSNRRLLAFNCCPPPDVREGAKPKDWLQINSWSFQGLCPGAIAPLADRLLVIDDKDGTLSYLVWDALLERPRLVRVTKPDPTRRILGITTCQGQVFMWTPQSIYEFRFNTQNQEESSAAVC